MPQMAPISWLILFFVFSIAFLLFNVLNYYCFNYTNNSSLTNNETDNNKNLDSNLNNKLSWKW